MQRMTSKSIFHFSYALAGHTAKSLLPNLPLHFARIWKLKLDQKKRKWLLILTRKERPPVLARARSPVRKPSSCSQAPHAHRYQIINTYTWILVWNSCNWNICNWPFPLEEGKVSQLSLYPKDLVQHTSLLNNSWLNSVLISTLNLEWQIQISDCRVQPKIDHWMCDLEPIEWIQPW